MQFEERHPAYDHLNAKENADNRHGSQPGDPKKVVSSFSDNSRYCPNKHVGRSSNVRISSLTRSTATSCDWY